MAILGLDGSRFKGGLDKARDDAAKAGKEMSKSLTVTPGASGPSPGGGGHGGVKSGAMRETLVLMREIGRGNWSRVPGSFSILAQQLGVLRFLFNPITIAVAALGGGIYLAYKWTQKLTEQLSDLKFPEIHPEYIAKHLQAANQAAEAQKAINKEVEKSVDLYESAAKAAERLNEHTRERFEHERKMNQYAEQKEMDGATTEQQRRAIRSKYSANGVALDAAEREELRKNKLSESNALLDESKKKQAQADSIKVGSKEHDDQVLKQRQEAAKEAQKFLDEQLPKRAKDMAARETLGGKMQIASLERVQPGVVAARDAKREQNITEARRRIQDAKDYEDKKAANDEQRKKKDELYKQAGDSKSKSAVAFKEAGQMGKDNAQKNKDAKEEAKAKLDAENGKLRSHHLSGDVNSLQKIGAYSRSRDNLADSVKSIARHVAHIASRSSQVGGHHEGHGGHPKGF